MKQLICPTRKGRFPKVAWTLHNDEGLFIQIHHNCKKLSSEQGADNTHKKEVYFKFILLSMLK